MIPRITPLTSWISAIAALLVVPYYLIVGQILTALAMLTLAALNAVCARS